MELELAVAKAPVAMPSPGPDEFIVIWHDGSQQSGVGVAGAASLTCVGPSGSGVSTELAEVKAFFSGDLTAACAEYFGLLLGLSELTKDPIRNWLVGRKLILLGDCRPIHRHLEENMTPSEDCQQLVPLLDEAKRLLDSIGRKYECRVLPRVQMHKEHKLAITTLRSQQPVLMEANAPTVHAAIAKAAKIWGSRTNRVVCTEDLRALLDHHKGNCELSRSLGESEKVSGRQVHRTGGSDNLASAPSCPSGAPQPEGPTLLNLILKKGSNMKRLKVEAKMTVGRLVTRYGGPAGWVLIDSEGICLDADSTMLSLWTLYQSTHGLSAEEPLPLLELKENDF